MLISLCPSPFLFPSFSFFQSALNAREGGAHRVEICSSIQEGGITPSIGMIAQIVSFMHKRPKKIHVDVLCRPRLGDYPYSNAEIEVGG